MKNKSKLCVTDIIFLVIGVFLIVLGLLFVEAHRSASKDFDAMSAQIEELSEDVNKEEGSCRVVSKTYVGVLDSVVTQDDGNEFDHYIVVGGSYITVSELEYLKAKDNIGKFVTVETELVEVKDADGDYTRTYSAVVTYDEYE